MRSQSTSALPHPPSSVRRRPPPGLWTGFRVAITAAAVLYFFQAVSAGQFLAGHYPFLRLHQLATTAADVCVVVALILAVLLVWPGRGRLAPLLATAVTFVLAQAQAATGAARLIHVHIPLGFAVILASWALAAAAWAIPARRLGRADLGESEDPDQVDPEDAGQQDEGHDPAEQMPVQR